MVWKTGTTLAIWMLDVSIYYIFILLKITHKKAHLCYPVEVRTKGTYSWEKVDFEMKSLRT